MAALTPESILESRRTATDVSVAAQMAAMEPKQEQAPASLHPRAHQPLSLPIARYRALDGLRGVAALFVVLLHVEWANHITTARIVQNGYLAVDLFFLLSGFVISANYSHRIQNLRSAGAFVGLRFFRLYPLHITVLIAYIGLELVKLAGPRMFHIVPEHQPFTGGQSMASLLTHVFLVQGLGLLPTPGWNGPSWSISCEFLTYAVFAVALLLGAHRSRTFVLFGALATAAAYVVLALTHGDLNVVFDLGYVRCIAGFFWGCLLHHFCTTTPSRVLQCVRSSELALTCLVVAALAVVSGVATLVMLPLFVLLVGALSGDRGPVARCLMSQPLQALGRLSYSIYMVHSIVAVSLIMMLKRHYASVFNPSAQRILIGCNVWYGDLLVAVLVIAVLALAAWTYPHIEERGRLYGRSLLTLSPHSSRRSNANSPVC